MLQGDTQGARQRPRDRGWEGSGVEGDKIKNGRLFIHNFLFIQNARLPSGSPCYVSEWEGIKKWEGAGVRGVTQGEVRWRRAEMEEKRRKQTSDPYSQLRSSHPFTAEPITWASLAVCYLCSLMMMMMMMMMMMETDDVTMVTELLGGGSGAYSTGDVLVLVVHCASSKKKKRSPYCIRPAWDKEPEDVPPSRYKVLHCKCY